MTPQDFDFLREMLRDSSGLVLTEEKQYLLECRLMPVAREHDLESLTDLVRVLRDPAEKQLAAKVTEAMTINESLFFRDKTPFENFTQLMLPTLAASRAPMRKLRIWCAAASTGQEPYSLAMTLKENNGKITGWDIEIIGTDLSSDVLEKAKAGLYSQFEVQRGLPIQMLVKYFNQVGSMWQIDSSVRAMIDFRKFNLLESFASLGTFDIIFCRNVLIYFDSDTKKDIFSRMARQLQPDGYLVLGAAETVIGHSAHFTPAEGVRGVYVKCVKDQEETAAKPAGGVSTPASAVPRPTVAVGGSN
jgi:chemotaxis protein methyltransferase CheR